MAVPFAPVVAVARDRPSLKVRVFPANGAPAEVSVAPTAMRERLVAVFGAVTPATAVAESCGASGVFWSARL